MISFVPIATNKDKVFHIEYVIPCGGMCDKLNEGAIHICNVSLIYFYIGASSHGLIRPFDDTLF